jgi:hypothetical protein
LTENRESSSASGTFEHNRVEDGVGTKRQFACSGVSLQPHPRLEPLLPGIVDERHEGDRHSTDEAARSHDVVERLFRRYVEDLAIPKERQPFFFA